MKIPRMLTRIYIISLVVYLALGVALLGSAYASVDIPQNFSMTPVTAVPTGNDDATVQAYYDYLWLRHLGTLGQTYVINPVVMVLIYGGLGVTLLLFYFFTYAWYARQPQGDLYPVEVFNGIISERGGKVDLFNWVTYAVLGAFMVFYIIWDLIFGQWM